MRIAVADDEPDMREYFQEVLPRLGHTVVAVAENGRELVERCRSVLPDLVITDLRMPELDGIDAAIQIYQERPIPVILVSANQDGSLLQRAETDHVIAYLVKPIKQTDLGSAIAIALCRFAQLQAVRGQRARLEQHIDH